MSNQVARIKTVPEQGKYALKRYWYQGGSDRDCSVQIEMLKPDGTKVMDAATGKDVETAVAEVISRIFGVEFKLQKKYVLQNRSEQWSAVIEISNSDGKGMCKGADISEDRIEAIILAYMDAVKNMNL